MSEPLDRFLEALDVLLTKEYDEEWSYDYDVDSSGVQIHVSIPTDFPEDGENETNDYEN